MGETTPLATTERHFSGARLTRAGEWLGNLGKAVAPQDRTFRCFWVTSPLQVNSQIKPDSYSNSI